MFSSLALMDAEFLLYFDAARQLDVTSLFPTQVLSSPEAFWRSAAKGERL